MNQILIIEDDAALGRGLVLALSDGTRTCTLAKSCAEARQALQTASFSLALLDINLPDGSGLSLLKKSAPKAARRSFLLTANDLETDIVTGLTLGADDYITKPFSLAVLRARVDAALRRAAPAPSATVFRQDGFVFDFDALCFSADGRTVQLSQTEQRLLAPAD